MAAEALGRLAAFGLLVLVWAVAAALAADPLAPGPLEVARRLAEEVAGGDLLRHLAITLGRVAAAFVLAFAIGVAIGVATGANRTADTLLDPWVFVLLNLPALVVIVLAYVWIGLGEAAAITAVALNKIPNVAVQVREGTRALDPGLAEMARVYRFSLADRLRHVILPELAPYLVAAARGGLALVWKIVLVVELIGRPNGIGFKINMFFQLFDVAAILAHAVAFVGVMLLVETFAMRPLERRASRWRRAAKGAAEGTA